MELKPNKPSPKLSSVDFSQGDIFTNVGTYTNDTWTDSSNEFKVFHPNLMLTGALMNQYLPSTYKIYGQLPVFNVFSKPCK